MTETELRELAKEWQRVLRLQDWDIRVQVVRQRDMTVPTRQGEVEYNYGQKEALVRVLDEVDFPPGLWTHDPEAVLVHELLHLHFGFTDFKGLEDDLLEQAIESIARGYVRLKRGE